MAQIKEYLYRGVKIKITLDMIRNFSLIEFNNTIHQDRDSQINDASLLLPFAKHLVDLQFGTEFKRMRTGDNNFKMCEVTILENPMRSPRIVRELENNSEFAAEIVSTHYEGSAEVQP